MYNVVPVCRSEFCLVDKRSSSTKQSMSDALNAKLVQTRSSKPHPCINISP